MSLTLTPDLYGYALAVSVVYCLSCPWVAESAALSSPRLGRRGFLPIYLATLAIVAPASALIVRPPLVKLPPLPSIGLWVLLGVAAGVFVVEVEKRIVRVIAGRARSGHRRELGVATPERLTMSGPSGLISTPRDKRPPIRNLLMLEAVAVLEEIIYRGVLLSIALWLPAGPRFVAIAGVVLIFALSHVSFGFAQATAKLPLGIVATLLTFGAGSVLPAAVAHGVVSAIAWQRGTSGNLALPIRHAR